MDYDLDFIDKIHTDGYLKDGDPCCGRVLMVGGNDIVVEVDIFHHMAASGKKCRECREITEV